MKAVVMAGGAGSRLRPITIERPKPMITLINKPVIGHIFSLLKRHGITEVIITLQYLSGMLQDYFGDGSNLGMKITYCIEDEPLGTAGGVKNVQHLLDDTFLVISGDALTDFDLRQIFEFHRQKQAKATIALYRVSDPLEFGVIITNSEGYVIQLLEKPTWGEVFSDMVNTGIYILEPEVLDWIPKDKPYDFSHQLFPQLLAADIPIAGYVAEGYWHDIGNISALRQATADMLEGKVKGIDLGTHIGGNIWVGGEVEISPTATLLGPIYLGNSVKIKDEVVIHGPTVIRSYSVIDDRAQIDRSIIWRNCYIGKGAELRGAIVLRHCNLKAKTVVYEGVVIGDGTVIGEGAVIHPDVKIWSAKEIEPGAIIKHSVIWGSQGRRVLFGLYGVTGMVNVDLTPEFSAKLGAALGATIPRGAVVTFNRDLHRGPRMLKRGAISGLLSAGIQVADLREQPIPVARYFTKVSDVVAGVHVRLSAFDERVVNINFIDQQGLNISKEAERQIERVFFREDFRRVHIDEMGTTGYAANVIETYLDGFFKVIDVEAIRKANFNLVIDYASAATATILPKILTKLGCGVVALNANLDESKMSISYEAFEVALHRLCLITEALGTTLGVRIDVGGECIFVVDNTGRSISGIDLFAAMAELVLSANPGETIAIYDDQPYIFEEIAARHGGHIIRTKVDQQALMMASLERDVIMAGDGKGNFIFPDFHPAVDGLMAIAKLLEFLALQKRDLSDVITVLPSYYLARSKVYCLWEAKGTVMRKLRQQFEGESINSVEGLKIVSSNHEWVLILPSRDQPYISIIVEALSQAGADKLLAEYTLLIESLQPRTM